MVGMAFFVDREVEDRVKVVDLINIIFQTDG